MKNVVNITVLLLFVGNITLFLLGCSVTDKQLSETSQDPQLMAYVCTLTGKYEKAAHALEESLANDPHNKDMHLNRVYCYLKSKDDEKSLSGPSGLRYRATLIWDTNIIIYTVRYYLITNNLTKPLSDFDKGILLTQEFIDPSVTEEIIADYSKKVNDYKVMVEKGLEFDIQTTDMIFLSNDYTDAKDTLAKLEHAYSCNSVYIDMLLRRAYIYILKDEYEKARSDYESAILLDKENPAPYSYRGELYLKMNLYSNAYDDFSHAIALDSEEPAYVLGKAKTLFFLKEYQSVVEVISKIFNDFHNKGDLKNNQIVQAYHLRGSAYLKLNNFKKVVSDYNELLEIEPTHLAGHYNRGLALNAMKHPDAMADFIYVTDNDKNNSDAWCELGIACMYTTRFTEAAKYFKQAKKIDPESYKAYTDLGYLYFRIKSQESWILSCLDKATELNPQYTPPYFYRAFLYRDTQRYRKSIEQLDMIIDIHEDDYKAYFHKAVNYELLEDGDNAIENYRKTIEYAPSEDLLIVKMAKKRLNVLIQMFPQSEKELDK